MDGVNEYGEQIHSGVMIKITEIALSYVDTAKKGDANSVYWAPVWAVVLDYSDVITMYGCFRPAIFYINAVDGTFVNPMF